jgi:N-acetylglutamate synthase-like GNAT family acetyltransferase
MEAVFSHPNLQGLRRWHLATRDAHGLYRQFGFTDLKNSSVHMEKWDPEIYSRSSTPSAT